MLSLPHVLLGLAWGALAAVPLAARAQRVALAERLGVSGTGVASRTPLHLVTRARTFADRALAATGPVGARRRFVRPSPARPTVGDAALDRELPGRDRSPRGGDRRRVYAVPRGRDRVPMGIAGCRRTVRVRVGSVCPRCELRCRARRRRAAVPRLRPLVDALLASDRLGAPVGPALARLAAEERAALRRRAEAHARRVPVRLLFPLTFLVLPAFVLITVVPGLAAGLAAPLRARSFPISTSGGHMFRRLIARVAARMKWAGAAGQTTAEYALVMLGAVAIATLLISWATGSHAISKLFDTVIDKVLPG